MMDWLSDWYLWLKAVHIIAVISWMAGMLYLPRLFIYHCDAPAGSIQSETFKVMERRLLKYIINPAMIVAWILGIALLALIGFDMVWVYIKLVAVILLTMVHHYLAAWRKDFEADRNRHPAKFYRVMNEVPTILMIIIVLMAVAKPF